MTPSSKAKLQEIEDEAYLQNGRGFPEVAYKLRWVISELRAVWEREKILKEGLELKVTLPLPCRHCGK